MDTLGAGSWVWFTPPDKAFLRWGKVIAVAGQEISVESDNGIVSLDFGHTLGVLC